MGVFFRTGENTAASVSWPVYVFAVLPLQLLFGFYKMLAYAVVFAFRGIRAGVRSVRGHEESRPPTP